MFLKKTQMTKYQDDVDVDNDDEKHLANFSFLSPGIGSQADNMAVKDREYGERTWQWQWQWQWQCEAMNCPMAIGNAVQ